MEKPIPTNPQPGTPVPTQTPQNGGQRNDLMTTRHIQIRVTQAEYISIRTLALHLGLTLNEIVKLAIENFLSSNLQK